MSIRSINWCNILLSLLINENCDLQGDFGGLLVADGDQIGIVSFGVPCGASYTDV